MFTPVFRYKEVYTGCGMWRYRWFVKNVLILALKLIIDDSETDEKSPLINQGLHYEIQWMMFTYTNTEISDDEASQQISATADVQCGELEDMSNIPDDDTVLQIQQKKYETIGKGSPINLLSMHALS